MATKEGTKELADWDKVFRALSHESRRRVLTVVNARGGSMTAGEIARRFSCAWATTTRHLGVLRDAGLLVQERQGREIIYRLDRERLAGVVSSWLHWFQIEENKKLEGEGK